MTGPEARPPPLAEQVLERGHEMRTTLARAAAMLPLRPDGQAAETFMELPPARILRYPAANAGRAMAPVLIIYSMINRPYLLDLQPRRSVIRHLTQAGADVYVLDWGEPAALDRDLDMEECIGEFVRTAVSAIRAAHEGSRLNVAGICQGGTMAVCHAALHPESVQSLANFAGPVDFHTPDNTLWRLTRDLDPELLAHSPGNLPSAALNAVFVGLKPLRLLDQRYFAMPELCRDDDALADFLRMERWMYDSPNQPAAAVRTFIRDFYQRNALYKGELRIQGRSVDLRAITMPLFNAYARDDHLIPAAAAQALERRAGSNSIHSQPFPGGHLGLFVSARAHREVYPRYLEWLHSHGSRAAAMAAR
ncbi:alpha/beta fold hydrolase [Ectothiorhodospiraceae bacterium WFHF3C12]|nr:alpha/beta fold hydrolase [Ectothiorhodospiraceae bacterium WFHF3C12]